MPPGHSDHDGEDGDDTPPTRSYVDALLRGNLSVDQVADLRAEIASRAEEESARLARSYPPPPRRPSVPPSIPPTTPRSFGSRPPAGPPSAPPTTVRSYGVRLPSTAPASPRPASEPAAPPPFTLPPIEDYGSSYGPGLPADPRVDPVDEDDLRTLARTYVPAPRPAEVEVHGDDDEGGDLTAVHIYTASEVAELIDLGDLGGVGAELGHTPTPTAQRAAPDEYDVLLDETYLAALGGAASVPRLALAPDRVTELPLGPQAAFVLSHLDGESSVEDVLDISGLGRLETLRILYDLLQDGVIRVPG